MTPVAILQLTQQYVPEFYRDSQRFKDSIDFLNNNEWGLALDSLIEMADESGHYFSETFWLDLSICADKMKLIQQAEYCRQQVFKNERKLRTKTPNGWTTIKLDDTHYEHKIAQIVEDKWLNERYKKDKVNKLLKTNGFHIKYHGRSGVIYYVDDGRLLEIGFELSAVSPYPLLLYFDNIKSWAIPKEEPLTLKDQTEIRAKLIEWFKAKRIKAEF